MRRTREQLAKLLEGTRQAAQRDIPAGNLRDQLNFAQIPPLSLLDDRFTGILPLEKGGTEADLSATGPGVVIQDMLGAPLSVLSTIPFSLVDWSSGSAVDGQPLLYESTGPTAVFGKITLSSSDIVQGVVSPVNGGTGVANGSGSFLTIPSGGGTAALIGLAQTFAENNAFEKLLRAHVTSGTTGYGIRFWDGANDFGNFQCLDLGGTSFLFFGTNRQYDGTGWQQLNTRVGGVIQVTGDTLVFNTFPVSSSTPTGRFRVLADGSMGIHGGNSFGGGAGVVAIANRTTAPTANPSGGGLLYAASGGGTWRGSGGTITTFGPAGPHCAKCGYDAWTVAMRNDAWQAYCYICGHCGAKYESGPASVLGLLGANERAQIIRPGMGYADLAAMLD